MVEKNYISLINTKKQTKKIDGIKMATMPSSGAKLYYEDFGPERGQISHTYHMQSTYSLYVA